MRLDRCIVRVIKSGGWNELAHVKYAPLTPMDSTTPWEYACVWHNAEESYIPTLEADRRLLLSLGVYVEPRRSPYAQSGWGRREIGFVHVCVDVLWPGDGEFSRCNGDDLVMPIIREAEPVLDSLATLWGIAHNVELTKYKGLANTYNNYLRERDKR